MATEVIWFEDRFGIKGQYLSAWLYGMKKAGLEPIRIRRVNLHHVIRGQLLTKHKTRKAPTWRPDRAEEIERAMQKQIDACGGSVRAIVLASPESLCVVGLDPDYATLSRLRGSVYDFNGTPALVSLPMSAWFTQISQKDIAVANYGIESELEMEAYSNAKVVQGLVSGDLFPGDDSSGNRSDLSVDRGASAGSTDSDDALPGMVGMDFIVRESDADDDNDRGEGVDDSDDTVDDEGDEDNFFYVPVMTPVGKMMITFDMQKLSRIVNGRAFEFWGPST